jgi:hypothetical protein
VSGCREYRAAVFGLLVGASVAPREAIRIAPALTSVHKSCDVAMRGQVPFGAARQSQRDSVAVVPDGRGAVLYLIGRPG